MNKKRLSVVMAGAMLASSVAPVLAAEVQKSEVNESNIGNLVNELTDLLWDAPRFSDINDSRVDSKLKGQAIYGIQIGNSNVINANIASKTVKDKFIKSDLQKAIQTELVGVTPGTKIRLINLGSTEVEENGKKLILSKTSTTKYTAEELSKVVSTSGKVTSVYNVLESSSHENYDKIIEEASYDKYENKVTIKFVDGLKNVSNKTLELTTDSDKLDFSRVIYVENGKELIKKLVDEDLSATFKGFPVAPATVKDIDDVVEKEYTITATATTYALSDLFDGVMLTEKGQNLLNEAKDSLSIAGKTNIKNIVKFNGSQELSGATLTADKDGVYKVKVEIADSYSVAKDGMSSVKYNTYYVTGTSKAELNKILAWYDKVSADVDVLAGEDRYETAVRIAKEVAGLKDLSTTKNIILVNGNSLVDGLAASPLAAKLGNAPILLTENGKLPKATKAYLQELVDKEANKDITVSIIGGKSVISDSVKEELKDMNLKVKRFGGDDREATSMAVAEAIVKDSSMTNAFVVGAKGEADAMSIAGKAAEDVTPIIVSGFGGLSEDTVETLEKVNVNVIGGENAVSKADFNNIKSVAKAVRRVSGEDRKATNAAVINTFYSADFASQPGSVIVSKDNILIDALTSANLSAVQHAPIVLGTKSLSDAQVNAIVKNAKNAKKVYQVGGNVERNVVKLVAQSLGLI